MRIVRQLVACHEPLKHFVFFTSLFPSRYAQAQPHAGRIATKGSPLIATLKALRFRTLVAQAFLILRMHFPPNLGIVTYFSQVVSARAVRGLCFRNGENIIWIGAVG